MIKVPTDYKDIGVVMTNFDHTINHSIEKQLMQGKFCAQYSGYDFCGYVWRNNNKWACEVWQYHNHIDTIQAEELPEIMDIVSEKLDQINMTVWKEVDKEIYNTAKLIKDLADLIMQQTLVPATFPDYTDFRGDLAKNIDLIRKMCNILEDDYKVKYVK